MTGTFEVQVGALRKRVAELADLVDREARPSAVDDGAASRLADLTTALEELCATGEKMAAEADALIGQRDVLEEERRYYRALFRLAPVPGLVTDDTGWIREATDRAGELLGARPRLLIGTAFPAFLAEGRRADFVDLVERARARPGESLRGDLELQLEHMSSEPVHVVAVVTASGDPDEALELRWFLDAGLDALNFQDLASSEQALSTARAVLRAVIESAADAIVSIDVDQRILVFNRAAEEMFGYSAAEATGAPLSMLIPGANRDQHNGLVADFTSEGDTSRTMAGRVVEAVRRDRTRFLASITISRAHVDGHPVVTALVRDVTDAVRARRELQFATEFNQRIVDTLDALVVVVDVGGRALVFNAACERSTGYRLADLTDPFGMESLLVPPDERKASRRALLPLFAGEVDRVTLESSWMHRNGGVRRIRWSNTALTDEDGVVTHVIGTGIDITHERELETRIETSQRLELLGQLAAGVAHDLNNMLSVTQGQLEFLAETEGLPASAQPRLDAIASALRRARGLVANLSTTGSPSTITGAVVHAHEAIRSLVGLMGDALGAGIELVVDLAALDDDVRIDPTRFEQVLLNLVVNARDALGSSGHVIVATRTARGADGPDGFLLTVTDDGPGMDADTLPRAFEPFFTTKPAGGGLGLATSAMVVEAAGGTMSAESDGVSGTTMAVWLPLASDGPRGARSAGTRR